MNDPDRAHARHDLLLIAAHAAGDTAGSDRDHAIRLIETCPACATLHQDLRALSGALRGLPAPGRPRDFTLSTRDATRLRPTGWRRLLAPLAGERFRLAAPVGTALASLGLAGLLFSSLGSVPLGGAGPAARDEASARQAPTSKGVTDPAPAAGQAHGSDGVDRPTELANPAPLEAAPDVVTEGTGQGPDAAVDAGGDRDRGVADASVDGAADSTVVVLSGTFLIIGLGLFGLRWTATRLGDG